LLSIKLASKAQKNHPNTVYNLGCMSALRVSSCSRWRDEQKKADWPRQVDCEHLSLITSYNATSSAATYLLPTTYYLLPTTYYLLPTTYYLLPTTYYLLPTTYYLLPTYLLPTYLPTRFELLSGSSAKSRIGRLGRLTGGQADRLRRWRLEWLESNSCARVDDPKAAGRQVS
jgi:hypothetical protein